MEVHKEEINLLSSREKLKTILKEVFKILTIIITQTMTYMIEILKLLETLLLKIIDMSQIKNKLKKI